MHRRLIKISKLILISTCLVGCSEFNGETIISPSPIESYIPSDLPEKKPSEVPIATAVPTLTCTPVVVVSATPTAVAEPSNTPTPVVEPTPTIVTPTVVPTSTPSPVPTATSTPIPTLTPTPTPEPALSKDEAWNNHTHYNITYDITNTYKIGYPNCFSSCSTEFNAETGVLKMNYTTWDNPLLSFTITYEPDTEINYEDISEYGLCTRKTDTNLTEIIKIININIPGNLIDSQNTNEPLKYWLKLYLHNENADNLVYEDQKNFDILLSPNIQ